MSDNQAARVLRGVLRPHHAGRVDGVLKALVVAALEGQVRERALQPPRLRHTAAARRQRQLLPAQSLLEALLALVQPLARLRGRTRIRSENATNQLRSILTKT